MKLTDLFFLFLFNMNHAMNIKLSKGNFMTWRTQLHAYICG
jgi:hypothetical protein